MSSHKEDCLCYQCIEKCTPVHQRSKIRLVVRNLVSFGTEFLNDWLFHLTLQTSGRSFSPIAIQFIQEGGSVALLSLIPHDYVHFISNEERSTCETIPDQITDKEYPTFATIILYRYLDMERSNPTAYLDLIKHNLLTYITRALTYAISTVRRNCIQILNCVIHHTCCSSLFENSETVSLLIQALITEIQRPRETLAQELQTTHGKVQRELLQESEEFDGFAFRYIELLKLDAIRTLKSLIQNNIDKITQILSHKRLIDIVVAHLHIYPHESLPESTCLYDMAEILMTLTHIPYQIYLPIDFSNQKLAIDNSTNLIYDIVHVYRQLNDLVVTKFVYDLHRKATDMGLHYEPKEMEKWGMLMYSSRLAILMVLCQLSYSKDFADQINKYDNYYVLRHSLQVMLEDCKDPYIGYIKSDIVNAPFIRSGNDNRFSCFGPDILGANIIAIRNLYSDQVPVNIKEIYMTSMTNYQDFMIKCASRFKAEGVELVSHREKDDYADACRMFTIALYILPTRQSTDSTLLDIINVKDLYVTLLSNRAEMYIQLGDYKAAISDTQEALTVDPTHSKSKSRYQRAIKKLK
jgi:tetratricopeptide (TPR) repeat protein